MTVAIMVEEKRGGGRQRKEGGRRQKEEKRDAAFPMTVLRAHFRAARGAAQGELPKARRRCSPLCGLSVFACGHNTYHTRTILTAETKSTLHAL